MTRSTANSLAAAFGTAFLISVGLQLFALAMLVGLNDFAYSVHSRIFTITPEQFELASYCFLGAMKVLGLTLFLVPWAALKLTAKRFPE